jgi:outer membrane protein assembly factor BamB
MMRGPRRGRLGLVAVVAAGLLAGCAGQPSRTPPGSAQPNAAAGGRPAGLTGPPAGVDPTPLLHSESHLLLTDELVVEAVEEKNRCHLAARPLADPRATRWSFDESQGRELTCLSMMLAGSTIVTPYRKTTPAQGIQSGTVEDGLVGLDGAGKVRWHVAAEGIYAVVAANERYALGTSSGYHEDASGNSDKPAHPATAVIDPATGRIRWQRPNLLAVGLDGDTVLARPDGSNLLTALDAATGQQRWAQADRAASDDVTYAGGGVVVRATVTDKARSTDLEYGVTIRDSRTGALLHEERPLGESISCVSDGKTAVVCQVRSGGTGWGTVFAYDLTTRRRTWNLVPEAVRTTHTQLRAMAGGRLFISTDSGGAILDATNGRQLAANLAAAPDEIRGAYGIVARRQDHGYDLYRLTDH